MKFSTIIFYALVIFEAVLFPFYYLKNGLMNFFSSSSYPINKKKRKVIENNNLIIGIHEWGKYPTKRKKTVNRVNPFLCGLEYQLHRFERETEDVEAQIYLTVSDSEFLDKRLKESRVVNRILEVSNNGMDFSGFSELFEEIKHSDNRYVILTNSSVNAHQNSFLKSHVNYMNNNPDVGMLGVSYSSRIYQTVIKNNFTPHLQSFYLLTTLEVLKEVVNKNKKFPGKGISDKLLLIRKGEIKLSQIILNLGYSLAVVKEDGKVEKFSKPSIFDNAYNAWTLKLGDVRIFSSQPNTIYAINE